MERIIIMSTKELDRAEVLSKLKQKVLSQAQAADILGISSRQVRRLYRGYKKIGAQALISKKRGSLGNHRLSSGLKEWALALIKEHYHDFGPHFAHEKLVEVHKVKISLGSARGLMISEGMWVGKRVKKKKVFQLRERRSKKENLYKQMDLLIFGSRPEGRNVHFFIVWMMRQERSKRPFLLLQRQYGVILSSCKYT